MPIIHRTLQVPYSVSQMYALVNAVEDYAEFLPWCKESKVLSRDEDEVHATLTLAGGGFQKSFTTCNRMQSEKMIEIRLVHGPFKQLEGFWRFENIDENSCSITLDLEFEFSNMLLGLAFGPVFQQVVESLTDAFSERAKEIYGCR